MSLRRIGVLLQKELVQGPKNFIFILGLVMPLVLTLIVSLIFGSFFSGKARLGVIASEHSQVVAILNDNRSIQVRTYPNSTAMQDAAARGAIDLGIVLPPGFDQLVQNGEQSQMTTYMWGESLMEHRITLGIAVLQAVRDIAGQEAPVDIEQIVVGDTATISWQQRVLPFIVLISIMMAGLMVPAFSMMTEKTKHTLSALSVSPATLMDIFAAKGLLGILLSMFGGIMVLLLNRLITGNLGLLLIVLLMSAILSSLAGVLLGAAVKDINTLFATMKGLGIFLYGPAIVKMFPEIPQWIGQVFPTYYILNPVLEITQNGAGFADVAVDLVVLAVLIVVVMGVLVVISQRMREAEAAA
jgi:ABC-2 type transport system permease protein